MKAEDTVMSKGYMLDTFGKPWDTEDSLDYAKRIAEIQAGISFKAGAKEVVGKLLDDLELTFNEELLQTVPITKYADTVAILNLKVKKWQDFRQAKVREWGL